MFESSEKLGKPNLTFEYCSIYLSRQNTYFLAQGRNHKTLSSFQKVPSKYNKTLLEIDEEDLQAR